MAEIQWKCKVKKYKNKKLERRLKIKRQITE